MADGSSKAIQDVRVGDQVKTSDPQTGHSEANAVTQLHRNEDTALTDVTVRDLADGNRFTIHTTEEHPFWSATERRWVDAAELTPGTRLATIGASKDVVVEGVRSWVGIATMYNLTVDDIHTYYVLVGDTPVLVHNCDWDVSGAELEAIEAEYGEEVANGVGYNVDRYAEGATGHALNGIGADAQKLAAYLAKPRTYGYVDASTGAQISYDAINQIVVVRTFDRYLGWMDGTCLQLHRCGVDE